jgi:alpha-amylase/alpha-mannosidase (GH57 family)
MPDIALAILWHQHQPYYPDDVAGENPMPWVRLHGVKDYYGMALHLQEVPEMRCTINLVPSLLMQLQAYTERGATDRYLELSRIPANAVRHDDQLFILDNFFHANAETMIRPLPRYWELYQRRNLGKQPAIDVSRRFQERDLRDLQVLFNLAWIHTLAFERDPELRELRAKGRYFTEAEKGLVLTKHLDILKQVIPLHRDLAQRGQIELTTTPHFHPILPLLLDKRLAREAMPDVRLPRAVAGYPEDAELHVRRAVEYHAATFGRQPTGMWPAEGSVCQPMIPLLARHGIRWIATDEEVLCQSLHGFVSRDPRGHVRNPEHMYRPYRVSEAGAELSVVFRDHALSDLIGFHYQRSEGERAAEDFVAKLKAIAASFTAHETVLVTVILDGENCWEHYAGGGVAFLRSLYQHCTTTRGLRPVRIGDHLQHQPPHTTLPHLFAGSWINHNFDIWVGHEEDNTAWDLLHQAREHLRLRQMQGIVPEDKLRQAWEELYIAEGSDWFWWYGPHHSSPQDGVFDYLFRKHLQNIYVLLGEQPPAELSRQINRRAMRGALHSLPTSFLDVKIDGRRRPIEWMGAGRYTVQNERGTMAMVTPGLLKEVYFGFTPDALLIRADCEGSARLGLDEFDAFRVEFIEPNAREVLVHHPGQADQRVEFRVRGQAVVAPGLRAAVDQLVELCIPFELLEVAVDQPLQFCVEVIESGQSRDRAPRDSVIALTRPPRDFERIMWDV